MSLLTIGTVAFDTIETPYGRADHVIGGAAQYIGLAASYFTRPIQIVSIIGDDFPQSELDFFKSRGFNLDGLQVKAGEKSFYWEGRYHDNMNGRDTLVTDLNVLEGFEPNLPQGYRSTKYVMLGNLAPQVQTDVLNQLDGTQKIVAVDTMNFWMDIAMVDLLKVMQRIQLVIINDEEARQLTGEHSLVKAAAKVLDMGPSYVIIKKGEHGALLFSENDIFFAPAIPLADVVDPTGAGDTFAGGVMGYLASVDQVTFNSMKSAVIVGSTMASFCVEDFSNHRMKTLTKEDIRQRIHQMEALTAFDTPL